MRSPAPDQLVVNGTGTLDGAISVSKGPGLYLNGMTFDVLVASNGLAGTFSSTNLPAATPTLSFRLNQLPDQIQVQANASFSAFARNPVERRHGEVFRPHCPIGQRRSGGRSSGDPELVRTGTRQRLFKPESGCLPGGYAHDIERRPRLRSHPPGTDARSSAGSDRRGGRATDAIGRRPGAAGLQWTDIQSRAVAKRPAIG